MPRARGLLLLLASLLALAACAGPRPSASPEPERLGARRMLAAMAKAGPVPLVMAGDAGPLTPAEAADLAARGITGLSVRFTTEGASPSARRLVLWFGPPPGATATTACGPAPLATAPSQPLVLLAVWCDDIYPVASAQETAGDVSRSAAERLIWTTTRRLFPDDYPETYGFNLFGLRVGLGGSFGF